MSSTASALRIAANKANGLKSTGPRTPEGKAAVANNAYKHGLRSEFSEQTQPAAPTKTMPATTAP